MFALGRRANFGIVRTFFRLPANLPFGLAVIENTDSAQEIANEN
jgi:hypothetical protein